jgi:hypothetical protein
LTEEFQSSWMYTQTVHNISMVWGVLHLRLDATSIFKESYFPNLSRRFSGKRLLTSLHISTDLLCLECRVGDITVQKLLAVYSNAEESVTLSSWTQKIYPPRPHDNTRRRYTSSSQDPDFRRALSFNNYSLTSTSNGESPYSF